MRERSFWGWGWADRLPSDEGRRTIAEQVAQLLGFQGLEVRPLPRIEAVAVPRSDVLPPTALEHLFTADPVQRVRHTYGRAYRDVVRGFRGDFRPAPDLVAYPERESDVAQILDWASGLRVAVVPFGGGTSVVGGVELTDRDEHPGVVSLDLSRLSGVWEVDHTSRLARIGAGTKGPEIEAALEREGLTLRHYPQSFEFSTLGGWIATRAGGHFATLYTHIDELVASLRAVTPTGVLATRTLPASGAGPDPNRLMIGSEGILGVITEAVVRVRARPRFRARAGVSFPSFAHGAAAVRVIAQSGLHPANCRLLDEREAALNGVCFDGSAFLILAFESDDHPLEPWLSRAVEIARGHGGRVTEEKTWTVDARGEDDGSEGADAWKRAFLEAPYLQSTLVSLGVIADTFETACTWSRFPDVHAAVIAQVRAAMKRVAGAGRITCRFSHVYPDGPALYYTFLCPAREGAELEQWAEIKQVASETLISQGATITHHHAVGRTHLPWYRVETPAPFRRALGAVKKTLDPAEILNPGVLVPQ